MLPTLSLCLIAKDEAAVLARCLESVRGAVDEIVLVDTGSKDDTVSIAEKFGAKVFAFPWNDDFSAARNEALAQASGDWILVLDADEVLLPGGAEALKEAIGGSSGACFLTIENQIEPDAVPQSVRLIRLFRNLPGIRYRGRVHEQVSRSLEDLNLSIVDCGARIFHDGYTEARIHERGKYERNLRLLEATLEEDPNDLYARYQLGKTLAAMGRGEEAEKTFRETLFFLSAAPRPDTYAFYPKLFLHLAALMERRLGLEGALEAIGEGVRLLPEDPELRWHAGFYAKEAGKVDEALSQFERCLSLARRPNSTGVDFERLKSMASRSAGDLWLKKATDSFQAGDFEGATRSYEALLRYEPEHFFAQLALGTIHFERKRFDLALQALREAERLRPGLPDIAFLINECLRLG